MAAVTKILLIDPNDGLGTGLKVIREREADLIDMTEFDDGISDATSTTNPGYVIKDEKVYRIIKTYFDLDNDIRIFLARLDMGSYDYIEEPATITYISITPDITDVYQGDTVTFTALIKDLDGINENGAYFNLSGNKDINTTIDVFNGVLIIGEEETGALTIVTRPRDVSTLSARITIIPKKK